MALIPEKSASSVKATSSPMAFRSSGQGAVKFKFESGHFTGVNFFTSLNLSIQLFQLAPSSLADQFIHRASFVGKEKEHAEFFILIGQFHGPEIISNRPP